MADYHLKILELLTINRELGKSFLKIKLSFDQEEELYWEIDEATANHLTALLKLGEKYKYRLSFYNSWDPEKKQWTSFLTRTYREHSEKIHFLCSENYLKELNTLKDIQQMNEIDDLSFIHRSLQTGKNGGCLQEQPVKNKESSVGRFTRNVLTVISIALILVFGYTSYHYFQSTVSGEEILVVSDSVSKGMAQRERELLSVDRDLVIKSSQVANLHSIELDKLVTYSVPEGFVALTFDDGPSIYTEELTDILSEYGVGGTFFFVGSNVKKYPHVVQYAHTNGYSIGSHSNNHKNMKSLSDTDQKNELLKAISAIESITHESVEIFRPPFGAFDSRMIDLMSQHHQKMVLWNVDPKDWKSNNADEIVNHIRNSKVSGSIILLHETKAVVEALPEIIEFLQDEGLQIVNIR